MAWFRRKNDAEERSRRAAKVRVELDAILALEKQLADAKAEVKAIAAIAHDFQAGLNAIRELAYRDELNQRWIIDDRGLESIESPMVRVVVRQTFHTKRKRV